MFKKVKQKLLNQKKIGGYLRYAIREVMLIVIGILIAVSINNWNEEERERKILNKIFTALIDDIKQDTTEVGIILDFYKKKEETFLKMLNDKFDKDEIGECELCPRLISTRRLFTINKRGFQQLIEYKDLAVSQEDTLVLDIVNFYVIMIGEVENLNNLIDEDVYGNLAYWRDHYPWFASFSQGKLEYESMSYFTKSEEYRNKVALHYILIYENYLPVLHSFQTSAETILKSLNERLSENQ